LETWPGCWGLLDEEAIVVEVPVYWAWSCGGRFGEKSLGPPRFICKSLKRVHAQRTMLVLLMYPGSVQPVGEEAINEGFGSWAL